MQATQEQINASPMSKQLWCLQFPDKEGNGLGLLEVKKEFLIANNDNSKIEKKIIALEDSEYSPDEQPNFSIFKLNGFIDVNVASISPNIFLFLEALFENKSQKVKNFHLNVYRANNGFITSDKNLSQQYPSIERLAEPLTYTSDEEGFLINHLGHKFLKFNNPLMAKFVSLAVSQYHSIHYCVQQEDLKSLGAGDFVITSEGAIQLSDKTRELSYHDYLQMKEIVKELNWNLHEQLLSVNDTLEDEY